MVLFEAYWQQHKKVLYLHGVESVPSKEFEFGALVLVNNNDLQQIMVDVYQW